MTTPAAPALVGSGRPARPGGELAHAASGGRPLPTSAGAAGVVICNEVMFPGIVAARVRAGAEYLVNLANDSWWATTSFSAMTFDMVTLRAVEQRRPVVRVSTSGPSGVIDVHGRPVLRSGTAMQAVLDGTVTPTRGLTLYARIGDAFALACAAAVAVALVRRARA